MVQMRDEAHEITNLVRSRMDSLGIDIIDLDDVHNVSYSRYARYGKLELSRIFVGR